MKRLALALAAALAFSAAPALAYECPMDMAAIDAALADNPSLGAEELAKVKELRALGQKQHEEGDHGAAVATLRQAMETLGIQ